MTILELMQWLLSLHAEYGNIILEFDTSCGEYTLASIPPGYELAVYLTHPNSRKRYVVEL